MRKKNNKAFEFGAIMLLCIIVASVMLYWQHRGNHRSNPDWADETTSTAIIPTVLPPHGIPYRDPCRYCLGRQAVEKEHVISGVVDTGPCDCNAPCPCNPDSIEFEPGIYYESGCPDLGRFVLYRTGKCRWETEPGNYVIEIKPNPMYPDYFDLHIYGESIFATQTMLEPGNCFNGFCHNLTGNCIGGGDWIGNICFRWE